MCVGGFAIRKSRIPTVVKRLCRTLRRERRSRRNQNGRSTRESNLSVRRAYVDYMAELVREGKVHFHLRFAPFRQYDHEGSGPRRIYDTVSKMYYQLLLHRALNYYGKQTKLFIRPDDGACTVELKNFIGALHIDGQFHYDCAPDCIDSITCLNSRTEPLLQFLDIPLQGVDGVSKWPPFETRNT